MNSKTCLAALLLCAASVLFAAEETPEGYSLNITGWTLGRERKTVKSSNRVTASFKLANTSAQPVNDIRITLTYLSGLGEQVAAPLKQTAGSLRAGESKTVTVAGDFIPIFGAYTLTVEFGGKKEEWFSNSDAGAPQARSSAPLKGVASLVLLGQEAGQDRAGRFSGTVRVKNEGTLEAKNTRIIVTYLNGRKKIGEWSGKLGSGTLAGGKEANIPFAAANAPRTIGGFEIRVTCDDGPPEAAISGGEFTDAAEVEFAQFVFKRNPPTSPDLSVKACVRNGLPVPVSGVTLTLTFTNAKKKEAARFVYTHPETLKPGDKAPVEFKMPAMPAFENFEQKVDYTQPGAGNKPAPAAPAESAARFKNLPEIEVIFTQTSLNEDKSAALVGALRNGRKNPVKDVVVQITLSMPNGKTLRAEKPLSDTTMPGETRNFVVQVPGAAGFLEYSYTFKFTDLPAPKTDFPAADDKPAAPGETPKPSGDAPKKDPATQDPAAKAP